VQELDPDEAVSLKVSQNIFIQISTSADLVFIHSNYRFLPDAFLKLENRGLPIVETIGVIKNFQNKLGNISVHEKFKKVI